MSLFVFDYHLSTCKQHKYPGFFIIFVTLPTPRVDMNQSQGRLRLVCGRVPWLYQYWPGGFMLFVVLCPGTPKGSTGSGSGFKASQKMGQWLKVSSDRLGEARNRTYDPWFTRHRFIPYTTAASFFCYDAGVPRSLRTTHIHKYPGFIIIFRLYIVKLIKIFEILLLIFLHNLSVKYTTK